MATYRNIIRCKSCKRISHYPHKIGLYTAKDLNSVDMTLCVQCGSTEGWTDRVEVWQWNKRIWYKPNTWFSGSWVV